MAEVTAAPDISVKTESDSSMTCAVRGIAVLPGEDDEEMLVVTDDMNSCIKTLNSESGQLLTHLTLSSKPWGVTAISSSDVVVTLPFERKIVFVAVGENSMDIVRSIDVGLLCYGVDYRNDQLAVSYCSPHKVQVLSMDGTVLYNILSPLFNAPSYLAFGQDGTTLYVSNWGSDTVMCMNLDGTIVTTYTDSDLQGPQQPVVASNGEVLVCAYKSHSVHHITSCCEKIRVLLSQSDGLKQPRAICVSEKKDRIYVGMCTGDIIKVFTVDHF